MNKKSYFYMVYGTLKGKVIPSMSWQVHSFLPIEQFIERFSSLAPEYNIHVFIDELYECQILNTEELK